MIALIVVGDVPNFFPIALWLGGLAQVIIFFTFLTFSAYRTRLVRLKVGAEIPLTAARRFLVFAPITLMTVLCETAIPASLSSLTITREDFPCSERSLMRTSASTLSVVDIFAQIRIKLA